MDGNGDTRRRLTCWTLAASVKAEPCAKHAGDKVYQAGQNQKYRDRLADRLKEARGRGG